MWKRVQHKWNDDGAEGARQGEMQWIKEDDTTNSKQKSESKAVLY